jgi:hypothetical protein
VENLKRKKFNPEPFFSEAIDDSKVLKQIMNNLLIKDDTVRYDSHKILLLVSESNPEVLYPKWDFFVDLLKSKNNFHKVIGI